jgi:hypothetical protein
VLAVPAFIAALQVEIDEEAGTLSIAAFKTAGDAAPAAAAAAEKPAGEKQAAKEGDAAATAEEEPTYHRSERAFGRVSRTLSLPPDADLSAKIAAKLEHGVLTLVIPKKAAGAEGGPRKVIDVEAA